MSEHPPGPPEPRELPAPTNPPGLSALDYRLGSRRQFRDALVAALAGRVGALRDLALRDASDPAQALLDAWATVLDVLSFYQERIANEGYLRTAVEPRSLHELARLIGYRPHPGVAAGVYLAFTLEDSAAGAVPIPAGTRAQSLPRPGELPQPFETGEELVARRDWNLLRPNRWRQQEIHLNEGEQTLILEGAATNMKVGDVLLLTSTSDETNELQRAALFRVTKVEPKGEQKRTALKVVRWRQVSIGGARPAQDQQASDAPSKNGGDRAPDGDGKTTREDQALAAGQSLQARAATLAERLTAPEPPAQAAPKGAGRVGAPAPMQSETGEPAGEATRRLQSALDPRLGRLSEALNQPGKQPDLPQFKPWPTAIAPGVREGSSLRNSPVPPQTALPGPLSASESGSRAERGGGEVPSDYQAQPDELKPSLTIRVYAMRVRAALFGHNAPRALTYGWLRPKPAQEWAEWAVADDEGSRHLFLETTNEAILPGSYVVLDTAGTAPQWVKTPPPPPVLYTAKGVESLSRAAYGLGGKTSRLDLSDPWWNTSLQARAFPELQPAYPPPINFALIRRTTVYAQSEKLTLAYQDDDEAIAGTTIELDRLYASLPVGRALIVEGRRTDETQLPDHEVATLQSAGQIIGHDGRLHTVLHLTNPLGHTYQRDTVAIYGNVVEATHGETREEVLGSGAGAAALQRFALARWPLTYVADETLPRGACSSLELFVDGVRWREVAHLVASGPAERAYALVADDEGRSGVAFGDGERGARPPGGVENLHARYRVGLGAAGNVGAGQISLLVSRPFGVKAVSNPIAAGGGAEREGPERIRRNAPLAVTALDRLVSRQDYEDFARGFAGVGKAVALELHRERGTLIHLTVAAADDAPLGGERDPLLLRLRGALRRFGDPHLALEVVPYERQVLLLRARARIAPDRLWERVKRDMRAALIAAFGFERRELGQDLAPSEVYAVLQRVAGVRFVDLDVLDSASAREVTRGAELAARLGRLRQPTSARHPTEPLEASGGRGGAGNPRPAGLILVAPDVPESIVLEPLP